MMWGDTDWHCHILPGVDDGPKSYHESLAMARAAAQLGFTKIVATPHFEEGVCENYREIILTEVDFLNDAIRNARIPVTVYPGSEIMLSPTIPDLLKKGRLMTVMDKGTHVLIELPLTQCPLWADHVLAEIRALGLVPVLAHPERYSWLHDEMGLIILLKEYGLKLQGNIISLYGKYGNSVKKTVQHIHNCGYIDCWGSDAHSQKGYYILQENIWKSNSHQATSV
jgi:protein-tyrosine phosphatase